MRGVLLSGLCAAMVAAALPAAALAQAEQRKSAPVTERKKAPNGRAGRVPIPPPRPYPRADRPQTGARPAEARPRAIIPPLPPRQAQPPAKPPRDDRTRQTWPENDPSVV